MAISKETHRSGPLHTHLLELSDIHRRSIYNQVTAVKISQIQVYNFFQVHLPFKHGQVFTRKIPFNSPDPI